MAKMWLLVALLAAALGLSRIALREEYSVPARGGAILVTGASTGIGKAASLELAKAGFVVFAGMRKQKDLALEHPAGVIPVLIDVTDQASIDSAGSAIEEALQKRNISLVGLVNNAGVGRMGPLEFEPVEEMQKLFDVNFFGVVRVTQRFLPLLRRSKGRILNVSSLAGVVTSYFSSTYCGSKHALEALTDSLRLELEMHGVSVSSLNPGMVHTEILRKVDESYKENDPRGKEFYDVGEIFEKNRRRVYDAADTTAVTSAAILHAMQDRYPQTRYFVANVLGLPAWLAALPKYLLPDRLNDRIARLSLTLEM